MNYKYNYVKLQVKNKDMFRVSYYLFVRKLMRTSIKLMIMQFRSLSEFYLAKRLIFATDFYNRIEQVPPKKYDHCNRIKPKTGRA
jgi:hypothetical protein